jgi:hypothetical protein
MLLNRVYVISIIGILTLASCTSNGPEVVPIATEPTSIPKEKKASQKIQILNFGTFHMGFTTDASTTEFDQHNKENQKQVHAIAQQLTAFQPTVIIVETTPKYDSVIQKEYRDYVKNPEMFFKYPSEIELLAYELGRLSGTQRIYGIDHKMGYNYMIGSEIENAIDSIAYNAYFEDPISYYPEVDKEFDSLNLLEQLQLTNHDRFLDFLITVNADMLTHAGTTNGFEGADETAKYYQRNLRMYSNLNRISLDSTDRVFILLGASHTAFFRDFISRSPKYEMVNTFDYLK